MMRNLDKIYQLLELKFEEYNQIGFIENDPIALPHAFSDRKDREIIGFFAAILAWGNRKSILNSGNKIIQIMESKPYDFVISHRSEDLKRCLGFVHRTFNDTDFLYSISFLHWFYKRHHSLEDAFLLKYDPNAEIPIQNSIEGFRTLFCSLPDFPKRTQKHIASPLKHSACKRINMFLRWMVRKDTKGVDFGIWSKIHTSHLICPCDVHVDLIARRLGLLQRPKTDWLAAVELTKNLSQFDSKDPVKYDYALFGLGIEEKWLKKSISL